mmetsp:Transcript_33937/g.89048  ORF Transcript_33937/g.89048 Transcript_33937/m.89048 type:complete len:267 (-) Transcript_33937:12-812(-)
MVRGSLRRLSGHQRRRSIFSVGNKQFPQLLTSVTTQSRDERTAPPRCAELGELPQREATPERLDRPGSGAAATKGAASMVSARRQLHQDAVDEMDWDGMTGAPRDFATTAVATAVAASVGRANEAPLRPWHISTRTVVMHRAAGDRIGLVVYSAPGSYGTIIETVRHGSPAETCGLRAGDVFVRLQHEAVLHCNHKQLVTLLDAMPERFECEVVDKAQMPTAKGRYTLVIREEPSRDAHVPATVRTSPTLVDGALVDSDEDELDWL